MKKKPTTPSLVTIADAAPEVSWAADVEREKARGREAAAAVLAPGAFPRPVRRPL